MQDLCLFALRNCCEGLKVYWIAVWWIGWAVTSLATSPLANLRAAELLTLTVKNLDVNARPRPRPRSAQPSAASLQTQLAPRF